MDTQGREFEEAIKSLGFIHKETNTENKMFIRFEFTKPVEKKVRQEPDNEFPKKMSKKRKFIEESELEKKVKIQKEGEWLLKPCIYKRR